MNDRKIRKGRPGLFLATVVASLSIGVWLGGCDSQQGSGSPKDDGEMEVEVPSRDINAVLDAHDEELMEIPGVVGVAVGMLDDGSPALLVLVVEETDEIKRRVPETIEGYPVKVKVTGEIRPLEGQ